MAGEDQGAVDAAPSLDPQVAAEAAQDVAEHPKPKAGWVRNIQTDTFHEVEDKLTVLAAYPGQYEDAKEPGKGSKKIGWKQDDATAE